MARRISEMIKNFQNPYDTIFYEVVINYKLPDHPFTTKYNNLTFKTCSDIFISDSLYDINKFFEKIINMKDSNVIIFPKLIEFSKIKLVKRLHPWLSRKTYIDKYFCNNIHLDNLRKYKLNKNIKEISTAEFKFFKKMRKLLEYNEFDELDNLCPDKN